MMMDDEPDAYALIEQMRASVDPVDRIVVAIWSDVTDRRGWRQEYDNFDADIQVEVIETWADMVREILAHPA
jgi:hypothetical protein